MPPGNKLRIVVAEGHLLPPLKEIFAAAGFPIIIDRPRTGLARESAYISKLALERPQEIPYLVKKGYFDLGFTGRDWLLESGYWFKPPRLCLSLNKENYPPTRIVMASSKHSKIRKAIDLPWNALVATEYPNITKKYFETAGRKDIRIWQSYGNTEHKVRYGASAIVDVIQTGKSLEANDLVEIHELMSTWPVVIVAEPQAELVDWFLERIKKVVSTFT